MKNKCPLEELVDYLKSAIKNPDITISEKIKLHAENCESCSNILKKPQIWKTFIYSLTCENTIGDKLNRAKNRSEVENVAPGQLWKIKISGSSDSILAITTSSIIEVPEIGVKSVRITPVSTTHSEKDTDTLTDMFLSESEMPLGLPCLLQWWNDRPVLLEQLNLFYGDLSEEKTNELLNRIKVYANPETLSSSGYLFRQIEIEKGKIISSEVFSKLTLEENALENDDFDHIFQGNVYEINFSSLSDANETLAMAAGTNNVIYKKIEDYIIKNELPFICLTMENKSSFLQIRSANEKEFKLSINHKNGSSKDFASDSRGIINLEFNVDELEQILTFKLVQ